MTLNCWNNSDTPICGLNHYNSGQQDEQLPILRIRVNFHFIGTPNGNFESLGPNNWEKNNGDTQAKLAVAEANNGVLSNLILNQIYVENSQLDWQYLGDSRLRVEIYHEEDEPSDLHNGVWYHDSNFDYFNFVSPYGDKVINVRVIDTFDGFDACSMRGATGCGGSTVTLNNWWAVIQNFDQGNCTNQEGSWNAGRILVHEILHQGNLCHSYKLENECAIDPVIPGGDLDPFWECGGAYSTDVDDSGISCGLSDPDTLTPCTSWIPGGSWNIMTEGVQKTCLSRCQWTIAMRSFLQNAQPWTDVCEVDEEPLIISSNTTWNTLKIIKNREVIIESGAELNINSCQVRMPANGVIRVKRGAKLDVSGSTITNLYRQERWGGIYVEGNVNKTQPSLNGSQASDDAGIVSTSNSTLTNARQAIVTHRYQEDWNSQYYGGLVDCYNTYFIDNKKGVAFYKYAKPNNSRIRECTFEESGNSNFTAYGGVSVWSCRNIAFSGNTFRNLDYGILPYNSKIRVLDGNDFRNLKVGIDIYATHPNASDDVVGNIEAQTGNSFSNNDHHIQINAGNGGGFSTVRYNDFVGAALPSIILDGEHLASIIDNDFSGDPFAFLSRNTDFGVVAFECNNVNSAAGMLIQGSNHLFSFTANNFVTNSADSYIENYGGSAGSVLMTQGQNIDNSEDYSPSNIFDHTSTSALDIVTLGLTIPFVYVNPTESSEVYTPLVLDNNYSLHPLEEEAGDCEDVAIGFGFQQPPYDDDRLNDVREVELSTKAEKEANPGDLVKEQMYALAVKSKEKVLSWLVKESIDQQDYVAAENYLAPETEVPHKKSTYGVKVMSGDYTGAEAYLETIPEENSFDTEFKMLQEINLQWLQSGAAPGVLLENSIVQSGDNSSSGPGFYLSEFQNSLLYEVAFSESPNRSTARALLALIKGERYTNPVDLKKYQDYILEVKARNSHLFDKQIAVYPNPANKSIFVQSFDGKSDIENVRIELFDMSGKSIFAQKIDGVFSKTRIDIQHIETGLYFILVKDENGLFHQEKIVILE